MPDKAPIGIALGLFDLLELIRDTSQADGVFVTASGRDSDLAIVASSPIGIAGRRTLLSPGLRDVCNRGLQPTEDLLLPSVTTGWLGFRPGFVIALRINWRRGEGLLFFWWKDRPAETASRVALKASRLVGGFAAQEAMANALGQIQERLDAMMERVSLGMVFIDSLRGSQLNPVAAEILGLAVSTSDNATVVAAMQALKANCRVESPEILPLPFESPNGQSTTSEFWISSSLNLALRVESHSVGAAQNPGRFWVFTDVKPLWDSTEKVRSANQLLERNLSQLAEEVERRIEAEKALLHDNMGLKLQNEELEIAKLESDLLANQDQLTGLLNRRGFLNGLEAMLNAARIRGNPVAVFYLDLDRFKQVNDALGHERGDDLLREVAARLVSVLRKDDLIARLGGDEFGCAVSVPHGVESDVILSLASNLRLQLNIPVEASSEIIWVSSSIGVAVYPDDATDPASLLRSADNAMYVGKRQGGNDVTTFSRSVR
jgi:diguanylate cyclase (GGDEF)-like protein